MWLWKKKSNQTTQLSNNMAGWHTCSLDRSSVLWLWNRVYYEHANWGMHVRCVPSLLLPHLFSFYERNAFIYIIEYSSRKEQTSRLLLPSVTVLSCHMSISGQSWWVLMAMLSFSSRTRGSGNQALCVGLSRTTLTTTLAPPLGKWQCVSFFDITSF